MFGLWLKILSRICPSLIWQGLDLALEEVYTLVAAVEESPMLAGLKYAAMGGVGMAICIGGKQKIGGHV